MKLISIRDFLGQLTVSCLIPVRLKEAVDIASTVSKEKLVEHFRW